MKADDLQEEGIEFYENNMSEESDNDFFTLNEND